ncbi:nucleoside triphosphate pyrophosphohydrolase family protein [Puerhibacterium puerhi]|uniref:pyrophosphatase n=1 Tax=Puerhibacterium puerhi TaxID=2692623 RepID=UPI001F401BAB|nr:pyrophosphatase [Puerhibacterium puerhi]
MSDANPPARPGVPAGGTRLADLADELEVISRVYERRFDVERTDDWLVLKLSEEMGELVQAYLARSGRSRRPADDADAAFRAEVADVLAQLLLVARRFGVDLDAELERKWFRWRHLVEPQDLLQPKDAAERRDGVERRDGEPEGARA